jgi:hypothetical protein
MPHYDAANFRAVVLSEENLSADMVLDIYSVPLFETATP